MNSFFIPQLGSQIYTMPGMTTQLNLQADKPGIYTGLSAQFSGPGFSDMRFTPPRRVRRGICRLGSSGGAREVECSMSQSWRSWYGLPERAAS